MLNLMRKNKKVLNIMLWLVIFAFLATIVVVWGVGDMGQANYVAKIGNEIISVDEYRRAYDAASVNASGARGVDFDKSVIRDMVNRRILLAEAKRLAIPISDNEIRRAIDTNPVFMENGVFSTTRYLNILTSNGVTTNAYENGVREDLLLGKLVELAASSVAVTEKEINSEYLYNYTELEVSYFKISAAKYKPAVFPDREKLTSYYEDVKERYTIPAKVKLKYIAFNPKSFKFKPNINDEMLERKYALDISEYMLPEALDLSHILVFVQDFNNEEIAAKAREKMEKALEELKSGKKFADIAKKYSEDSSGAFVGRISKSETPSELESTIFNLKSGEYTDIITNPYGFQIFKADNHTETKLIPFEEVRNGIRDALMEELTEAAYRDYLFTSYRNILKAGNITAYAALNPNAFEVKETSLLSAKEAPEELFTLLPADVSGLINDGDTTYIYELLERMDERVPSFDEVFAAATNDYLDREGFLAAQKAAEEKVSGKTDKTQFAGLAKQFGANVVQMPAFKRVDSIPEYEWAKKLSGILFEKVSGDTVIFPENDTNDVFVAYVNKVSVPEGAAPDIYRQPIISSIMTAKQNAAAESLIESLRAKYKVKINPAYEN